MSKQITIALLTLFVSMSGCAKDYGLAPPEDSEQITVTVKVPQELTAETMQVMYRSTLCTFTDYTASGRPYQRDGHQSVDIQPVRQGQSDLYEAKLAKDGGGVCRWRLSNVTFGVIYDDPTHFGENVTYGAGGGVVVVFDHNNSPRGQTGIEVDGDPIIKKDYYPWLSEAFLGGYRKQISLTGEGSIFLGYQALQARRVYFEPILHSNFAVTSVQPKVKKRGNHTSFTYPDGSISADGRSDPDFRKLQTIRLAAESNK